MNMSKDRNQDREQGISDCTEDTLGSGYNFQRIVGVLDFKIDKSNKDIETGKLSNNEG